MKKYRLVCLFVLYLVVNIYPGVIMPLQQTNTKKESIESKHHKSLDDMFKAGFLRVIETVYNNFLKNSDKKEFRIEWLDIPSTNYVKGDYLDKIKIGYDEAVKDFNNRQEKENRAPLINTGSYKISKEELNQKTQRTGEGVVKIPIRTEDPPDAQVSCTAYPLSFRKGCKVILLRCWIPFENKGEQKALKVGEDIFNPPKVNENEEKLEISALYRCPGCDEEHWLDPGSDVHTGGLYWFDIKFPKMHGHLIVYQVDSSGKVFNLFPGTQEALKKGHYKVPYHLFYDCTTKHLQKAAENSEGLLDKNIIRIGSYQFDRTVGEEQYFFYYSDKRSHELERYLSYAIAVGEDIYNFKGTVTGKEPKSPKLKRSILEKSKIKEPLEIDKIVTFRLIHKNQ